MVVVPVGIDGSGGIQADRVELGENVTFGKNVRIKARGTVRIGDNSYIGDRFTANCENMTIGEYFYNTPTDSRGMVIGGGGSDFIFSNITFGDKCTCHTGHINLAREVVIGNGVGLSHDVDIVTHGFWNSFLEGYPTHFKGVEINDGVIIGWKTIIMPGVTIAKNIVVGAGSVVVKPLDSERSIYAGNPAKYIKAVRTTPRWEREHHLNTIAAAFLEWLKWYDAPTPTINVIYPNVIVNGLGINVEHQLCDGDHDEVTDAFRDFIRRFGIRVFHPRGFAMNLRRK